MEADSRGRQWTRTAARISRISLLLLAWFTTSVTRADTNLLTLSLSDLMTKSIMRVSEPLSSVPAAVAVVTGNDIHRSGARTIPEALRLVPGLNVAQLDAAQWAVSARGFNDVFANKLLVMQDGRSIYTPLFSGVFWDVQGTMMEDIDRIEVVRGPGATLWGANAVNGVINIITKSAKETQGTLLTAGGGTQYRGFAGARYGGQLNENTHYRFYAAYANHNDAVLPNGNEAFDSWHLARGGFRVDWDAGDQNSFTFQGDGYAGWFHQIYGLFNPANPPTFSSFVRDEYEPRGGNVLGRWTRVFSASSELKLQVYYDRTEREAVIFREERDTVDLDLQHQFALGERNNVVWGFGYRVTSDREANNPTITFTPDNRTVHLFSAFVQDELTMLRNDAGENVVNLTFGSKFEHNDYTGIEIQPGARLLWAPRQRHTLWASISRAVRTPSRAEDDIALTQPTPGGPVTIYGNRRFESEELTAYELGYRARLHETFSVDAAAFYNVYDNLRSIEFGPSPTQPPGPFPTFPLHAENRLRGETYGAEFSAEWRVNDRWRLRPAYTFFEMQLRAGPGSTDTMSLQDEGKNPQHQFSLRSSMTLPHNIDFDCTFRYVDNLSAINVSSYVTADVRLGWRINRHWEIAVVGQNLVENRHAEFRPSFITTQTADIPRSVYGQVTCRF